MHAPFSQCIHPCYSVHRLHDHATRIETAIYNTISNIKVKSAVQIQNFELTAPLCFVLGWVYQVSTKDVGGEASTSTFVQAIIKNLPPVE